MVKLKTYAVLYTESGVEKMDLISASGPGNAVSKLREIKDENTLQINMVL